MHTIIKLLQVKLLENKAYFNGFLELSIKYDLFENTLN